MDSMIRLVINDLGITHAFSVESDHIIYRFDQNQASAPISPERLFILRQLPLAWRLATVLYFDQIGMAELPHDCIQG